MRTFFIKLLNLFLIAAVLFVYQSYALERQEKADAYEKEMAEYQRAKSVLEARYRDGVYEGSGDGYGGKITVRVTIEGHSISGVEILAAENETPEYLESAKKLLPEFVAAQSAEVDVVTGATLSSAGIILGVSEALEKSMEK